MIPFKFTLFTWLMGLFLTFSAVLSAFDYSDINVVHENFPIILKTAKKGDVEAQLCVGVYYLRGFNGENEALEGIKWVRKAADKGHVEAQILMGSCFANGTGVKQSPEEAVKWYQKALKMNSSEAQYRVGLCYLKGEGVSKDIKEGVTYIRKSAEQGNYHGQSAMGDCCLSGQGVVQDYHEAIKWYKLASEQGFEKSQYLLGFLYAEGVLHDYKEAVKWYKMASEAGVVEAQCELGKCYAKGLGIPQNVQEALRLFDLAASAGSRDAELNIWFYKDYPENKLVELSRTFTVSKHRNSVDILCDQDVVATVIDISPDTLVSYKTLGYNGLKGLPEFKFNKLIKEQNYIELLKFIRTEDDMQLILDKLEPYANQGHTILMFELSRTCCVEMEMTKIYTEEKIKRAFDWWLKGCVSVELDVVCNTDPTTKGAVDTLPHFFDPYCFLPEEMMHNSKNIKRVKEGMEAFCQNWTPPATYPSPLWLIYHGSKIMEGTNSLVHPAKWNELRHYKFLEIMSRLKKTT